VILSQIRIQRRVDRAGGTMTTTRQPVFRDLDAAETRALLARNHVARIAYSFHNQVDIEPISYVYADGAIYMRTAPGSKLVTLAHAPWVAFEVDEVRGPFDWQSVVVHGTVYLVPSTGSPSVQEHYRHAVQRLQEAMPDAFGDDDPAPDRHIVIKLHIDTCTGREARR
jgi:nitroimidazol reductase NimA-like FMN-containing flavoprotein (pyridoxamine 5'-phosphate oxidase superfamily)